MADNLYVIWEKFFKERSEQLWTRTPGAYRSQVVETNDPLNMRRIRWKCPDLHNFDLKPEECPWATPCPSLGSKKAGSWVSPSIGDLVWITFERGHPYGPIWTGFATPTRRRFYPLPQINQKSPLSVNDKGDPDTTPDDTNEEYLPKDGRPMSSGFQDRYGNLDFISATGFYPKEHDRAPPPPDLDPLLDSSFSQATSKPEVNAPDVKMMARVTKYGHIQLLGDQGYNWQNEFSGDTIKDEEFEIKRWKYLQRLLNEDKTEKHDQRNQVAITRYGHRLELRDTGWAQPGPKSSMSRPGEYGDPVYLSDETENDFRWAKLRTKGGWLLQAYDKGFDPQDDEFIKRLIIDEVGAQSEKEDVHWKNKDARWFRIVGRHGMKFVIDERGTDPKQADTKETPRANGIMLKGRRTGACHSEGAKEGDPRGFYFEFNENDDANRTNWGSPLGHAMEMNDATEYVAIVAGLARDYARPWKNLEENEFLLEPVRSRAPDENAYHLILDHQNEFLRLKTRGGKGVAARDPVNPSDSSFNQGLEARDGGGGDGPWTELVDSEHRGIWMSKTEKLHIIRAKEGKTLYIWFDENSNEIVIYNGVGKIKLFSGDDVNVITKKDVKIHAKNIELKADEILSIEAGGTPLTMRAGRIDTQADIHGKDAWLFVHGAVSLDDVAAMARTVATEVANAAAVAEANATNEALHGIGVSGSDSLGGAISAAASVPDVIAPQLAVPDPPTHGSGYGDREPGGDPVEALDDPKIPAKIEPSDRAKCYNSPVVCPQDEVEHPV